MKTNLLTGVILGLLLTGFASCVIDDPDDNDYSGTWTCTEQSALSGQQTFQVQVRNDLVISGQVYVANFYNLGFSEEAIMLFNGSSVTIPFQTLTGFDISGNGSVVNINKLTLDYIVSDGIDTDTLQAVLVR